MVQQLLFSFKDFKYKKIIQENEKQAVKEGFKDQLGYFRRSTRKLFIHYIQKTSTNKIGDERLCQCLDFLKNPNVKYLIEEKFKNIKQDCQKVCFK